LASAASWSRSIKRVAALDEHDSVSGEDVDVVLAQTCGS
jgi:hypothetical protein